MFYGLNMVLWQTKKLLLISLIQCHIDFACSFWYLGLSMVLKDKLQVTQNEIIRFVLNVDSRAHVGSEVFQSLGWLSVSKRVDQIIFNHVFKVNSRLYSQALYSGKFHTLIWN